MDSEGVTVVDFFAGWCQPCQGMLPVYREASMAGSMSNVTFGSVDCAAHGQLCQSLNIHNYPTVVLYPGQDGEPVLFQGDIFDSKAFVNFVSMTLNPAAEVLDERSFAAAIQDGSTPWVRPKALPTACRRWHIPIRRISSSLWHALLTGHPHPSHPSDLHACSSHVASPRWQGCAASHPPSLMVACMQMFDFYAPWCQPCMQLKPMFEQAAHELRGLVKFGLIDCTQHTALCQREGVQ
jgi:thioredoxin-like negative regulator of GroEL